MLASLLIRSKNLLAYLLVQGIASHFCLHNLGKLENSIVLTQSQQITFSILNDSQCVMGKLNTEASWLTWKFHFLSMLINPLLKNWLPNCCWQQRSEGRWPDFWSRQVRNDLSQFPSSGTMPVKATFLTHYDRNFTNKLLCKDAKVS